MPTIKDAIFDARNQLRIAAIRSTGETFIHYQQAARQLGKALDHLEAAEAWERLQAAQAPGPMATCQGDGDDCGGCAEHNGASWAPADTNRRDDRARRGASAALSAQVQGAAMLANLVFNGAEIQGGTGGARA